MEELDPEVGDLLSPVQNFLHCQPYAVFS